MLPDSPASCPPHSPIPSDRASSAAWVLDHISALVAYWNAEERCVFSNEAYRHWFGKSPREMAGISLAELLGPLYEKNLPFIKRALAGEQQVFERRIPLPDGTHKDSVAIYTPHVVDNKVLGFTVQVYDVTKLRQREAVLAESIRETIGTLEKTKGSFRSKDLGILRQRLEQVLDRLNGP